MTDLALPTPLDRTKVTWSYTFLHTYDDVCPHQAYRRYIKKDLPFTKAGAKQKLGQDGHKAMERRLTGKPLPDEFAQYERFAKTFDDKGVKPELKLGITLEGRPTGFFDTDTWGRGMIDVPIINGKTAYLGDWKFGASKYESPFELEVHAVLLHARHPELTRIVGQYIYLGENKLSELYDLSHTTQTWKKIGTIMSAVEADRKAGHFEKRQGPLCGFCPVRDCENNKNRG